LTVASAKALLREVSISSAASRDPCKADIVATAHARPVGFGSRINRIVAELFVAWYTGRSFALCNSSKNGFLRDVLSPHLDSVANFPVCTSELPYCGLHPKGALVQGDELGQKLRDAHPEYLLELKRFLYPRVYALSKSTRHQVDQRLASAGLVAGEKYVAVHVRRGDKLLEEAEKIESGNFSEAASPYLRVNGSARRGRASAALRDTLLRELRTTGASVVYVSSDDSRAKDEISEALGGRARVVEQPRGPERGYETRTYKDGEDLMLLLADLEALRGAKAFIGTASSNIGRLVYYLRPPNSASISLDEDWLLRQK